MLDAVHEVASLPRCGRRIHGGLQRCELMGRLFVAVQIQKKIEPWSQAVGVGHIPPLHERS
jgi:hypothetical protein